MNLTYRARSQRVETQLYIHPSNSMELCMHSTHTWRSKLQYSCSLLACRYNMQAHCYVFVSRCAKYFSGNPHWVYWCSCDQRRSEFLDSLSSTSDTSFQEVSAMFPECLHITSVQKIVNNIDALHGISVELDLSG